MCSAACSSSLKVNLELTLPTDIKVSDIKWLSVWCRKFKLNMGDLVADFMLANAEEGAAEAEAETVEAEAETVEAEAETVEAEAEAEVEEDDHHSGYFENPSISSVTRGNLVGNFKTYQHGAAGRVFAVDEQTLRIEGFEYDGKGPDAYFIAGIKGSKPGSPGSRYLNQHSNQLYDKTLQLVGFRACLLSHKFNGLFYNFNDNSAPKLTDSYKGVSALCLKRNQTM